MAPPRRNDTCFILASAFVRAPPLLDHKQLMLKPGWRTVNRITRYTLSTTLHWLNFSTQTYRKLKQLHRCKPFNLIQYPNYSSCGLFSIPLLRTSHVVRASSYESDWNSASGMKRSVDSTVTGFLERLQYKLTPNVHGCKAPVRNHAAPVEDYWCLC